MNFHTDEEEALLETFRQNGGWRVFFHRRGKLKVPPAVAKTLSRLIRSGHIERYLAGDFHCIYYRLKETQAARPKESAPAQPTTGRDDGES